MNEFSDLPLFVEPQDPRVRGSIEEPRLNKQSLKILARLKEGPAYNTELLTIAQRFGARIHDLRNAGYEIDLVFRDRERGLTQYAIKPPVNP